VRSPFVLFLALGLAPGVAPAQDAGGDARAAEALFVTRCSVCHSIGHGRKIGPDLKGATERRERAWLHRFIKQPSKMFDSDPIAKKLLAEHNNIRMTDLGLPDDQIDTLIDLLARCSKETCDLAPPAPPAPTAAQTGAVARPGVEGPPITSATANDVAQGKDLFFGDAPPSAGGPACISCHTVTGAGGVIPGGKVGGDLTYAFARLGDAPLEAHLRVPRGPMMRALYTAHPLDANEIFALRAFLFDVTRRPAGRPDTLHPLTMGVAGLIAVLVLLNAVWPRRQRPGRGRAPSSRET